MDSVARWLVVSPLIVAFAAAAACSSEGAAPGPTSDASVADGTGDASVADATADAGSDADLSCHYRDFRGNDVVCPPGSGHYPDGSECPSPDGCNYVTCYGGKLMQSMVICSCATYGILFNGMESTRYGTHTADDGCTVCTCGKDTGAVFKEDIVTCDDSACK